MAKWMDRIQDIFGKGIPVQSIPAGIYHYQSPPETDSPYRLHLRLEKDGRGLLIINAHTTLHLNQTAAEFAYYMVQGYAEDKAVAEVTRRYNIKLDQAKEDYLDIVGKIKTLIQTQDLEPENYLSIDSQEPYTEEISAPYRLDCGLTYKVNTPDFKAVAPHERVKRELLTEEWLSILTKAWNAGIPHIVFTGGEPTLRPDLAELLAHCQSLGQVTGLLTDGLRLSDHEYLHSLLNEGLDHIMLLLDPKNEQSWEAIKDVLVEDIFLTVHLTITPYDQSQVFSTIERLEKMGVKNLSLSAKSVEDVTGLKESSDFATSKGLNLVWDIPVPYSTFNPFNLEIDNSQQVKGEGYAWLYLEPDGDVLPSQGENTILGNMLTDDWSSIWANRIKPIIVN